MTAHITKTWFEDGRLITQVVPESEIYKREWVGLTHNELIEIYNRKDWDTINSWEYEQAIEAKLKEKNT